MTPERHLNLTLDLSLRVGELLLSSGAGAADVTATMMSIARTFGAHETEPDVTFTSLGLTYHSDPAKPPIVLTRQVNQRAIDYQDLTRVDHLVRAILNEEVDLMEARSQLRRIVSTGHDRPRWTVTLGWGAMCTGIAVLLGGGWQVMLLAFLSAALIDRLQIRIAKRRLPAFYQQVAGGAVASLAAVGASATPLELDASLAITANIVMLLSGIGFMGGLQDALSGFYITAGARLTEAMLSTAGIIAGVSGGLSLGNAVGVRLPAFSPNQTGFSDLGLMALGAAVAAAGFAYATYSPARILVPVAVMAALAMSISNSIAAPGIARTWSVAFAALFVGFVGYAVASRLRVPPLIVVISAITPMLPGISIYRGLSLLGEGSRRDTSEGLIALITAASVALAIAAGVILGEYIAQPLEREARKVESRLAGPRLVGPVWALSRSARRRGRGRRGPRHPGSGSASRSGSGGQPARSGASSPASTASQRSAVAPSYGGSPARTATSTSAQADSARSTRSSG